MTNNVLVNGTGTIGEPLIALLLSLKNQLKIDKLIFYKHTARLTDRPMLTHLRKKGGLMCVEASKMQAFKDMGVEPDMTWEEALKIADVVADATKENVGMKNKELFYLKHKDHIKGFLAQGSESEFGKIYAAGINDKVFTEGEKPQFVQIASCNTHAAAAAIKNFAFKDGVSLLDHADLTFIRRSSDVSQTKGVQAPTITAFDDPRFGTHHAKDVWRLFETEGHDLNLFSSAMKINSQYMHSLSAHIELKEPITKEEVLAIINNNPLLALTYKNAINQVFSFGRDHGHFGRILNQAVIVEPSIHIDGNHLKFWSFTPQDGNAILSSVKAICYYLNDDIEEVEKLMKHTEPWLFKEV